MFLYQHHAALIKSFRHIILFFYSLGEFVKYWHYFFHKYLAECPGKPFSWEFVLLCGVILNFELIYFWKYGLFKFSLLFYVLLSCVFLRICPFHLNFQISNIILWTLWCLLSIWGPDICVSFPFSLSIHHGV